MPSKKSKTILLKSQLGKGFSLKAEMLTIELFSPLLEGSEEEIPRIEKAFHFLWKYCPFDHKKEYAYLLSQFLFSEAMFKNLLDLEICIGEESFAFKKGPIEEESTFFGKADILFTNQVFGVYRLRIAPGNKIPNHYHRKMKEKEFILSKNLYLNGKHTAQGSIHIWDFKTPHEYINDSKFEQSILCIDEPPFDPKDEIAL